MKIELIDSSNKQINSVNFSKTATFDDVIKRSRKFVQTDNYTVTYGGEDIKKFGKATIESRILPNNTSFYITYKREKLKNPVAPPVPKIKIQIINSGNGQIHPMQVRQNVTFESILNNALELASTDTCTVTFGEADDTSIQNAIKAKITTSDEDEFENMTATPLLMFKSLPKTTGKIVIDMSWGYSSDVRDYTDAACLLFNNYKHVATVNLDTKLWSHEGNEVVAYSGRGMNDRSKRGFNSIDIYVSNLPSFVTHLFMIMSAWSNTDLSHARYPALRFFDGGNEKADLCNTAASCPPKAETLILSYMKQEETSWKFVKSGETSKGSASNYKPVINKIQEIIRNEDGTDEPSQEVAELMTGPAMPMSVNRLDPDQAEAGPVEIVFSFDTTGSMYSYLEEVRKCVHSTITELLVEIPTIRICVFAHGDYCDKDKYVTKHTNFTNNKERLCGFVDTVEKTSGGDAPECYELALLEVGTQLDWSVNSKKSLVMIGDATPHGKSEQQNYLHLDWKEEATSLFENKGIHIYAVQCNESSASGYFWEGLARIGHGRHLDLKNFKEIVQILKMISKREGALA